MIEKLISAHWLDEKNLGERINDIFTVACKAKFGELDSAGSQFFAFIACRYCIRRGDLKWATGRLGFKSREEITLPINHAALSRSIRRALQQVYSFNCQGLDDR